MQKYKMWIDGKWTDAVSSKTYKAFNPATEEEIAEIPLGDKADVDKAVEAARKAFPVWSKKSLAERCEIALKISAAVRELAQEFGELDIIDHGTPVSEAVTRVLGTLAHFDWTAHNAKSFMGDVIPWSPVEFVYQQYEPIGVAACITPWNVPFTMVATKLAPAMIMGNTCVVKPPSTDSMEALKLAEVLDKMDLPPGTINIITGPGGTVGTSLASHPDVDLVAFTGSSATGKAIMSAASSTVKRIQLELGGKNPIIVLDDADVDTAAIASVTAQIRNTGQICAAPGRFYIHEKVYDEFLAKFVDGMKKVVVGDPRDEKTQMGPVVSAEHRDRVEAYIKSGIDEGAELILGGKRPTQPPMDKGYYVMPTVFTHVKQDMKIAREEIFGPVACFMEPFTSEEKVIELANDNTYGLFGHIWTRDGAKAMRLANDLCAGTIRLNDSRAVGTELPWGGFKESGLGKDNGMAGLLDFVQLKRISMDLSPLRKR